jgi:TRAP-type transport system periplasmic protein
VRRRLLPAEKIRSYSPVARMVELIGAQPATIQAAELTQALATGVVNARSGRAPVGPRVSSSAHARTCP